MYKKYIYIYIYIYIYTYVYVYIEYTAYTGICTIANQFLLQLDLTDYDQG